MHPGLVREVKSLATQLQSLTIQANELLKALQLAAAQPVEPPSKDAEGNCAHPQLERIAMPTMGKLNQFRCGVCNEIKE